MCLTGDPSSSVVLNFTWILNASIIVLSCFILIHWSALTWILGSAAYSTLMEIFGLGFMVYILLGGVMMLGSLKHIRSGYLHLHRSRGCHAAMMVVPVVAFGFFLSLALLALLYTPMTTSYLKTYSDKVFNKADSNNDTLVDYFEFSHYVLDLPAFQDSNTSDFRTRIVDVFDALDTYDAQSDGFVHREDIYNAAYSSLAPSRRTFGICSAVFCGVIWMLCMIWWYWFVRIRKDIRSRGRLGLPFKKGKSAPKNKANKVRSSGTGKLKRKLKKRRSSQSRPASSTYDAPGPSSLTLRHGELEDLIEPENKTTTDYTAHMVSMPATATTLSTRAGHRANSTASSNESWGSGSSGGIMVDVAIPIGDHYPVTSASSPSPVQPQMVALGRPDINRGSEDGIFEGQSGAGQVQDDIDEEGQEHPERKPLLSQFRELQ